MNRLALVVCCLVLATYNVEAGPLETSINTFLNTSTVKLNESIALYNTTLVTSLNSSLVVLNATVASLNAAFSSILTKYTPFGVNTTNLKNGQTFIGVTQLDYNTLWLKKGYVSDIQSHFLTQVAAVNTSLMSSAATMTVASQYPSLPSISGTTCLNKYGALLTGSPVSVDRLTTCVKNELPKVVAPAANATSIFNFVQNLAPMLLGMVNSVCSPGINTRLSTCISAFFDAPNWNTLTYGLPNLASDFWNRLYAVNAFRVKRCASLVSADIISLAQNYTNLMTKCMATGS
ncbi:uncharacterized protein LOC129750039 [Uranotaenia lowii]|uniref:uncharacterized protein LOC129750039 n=1 Tax=Uranotaenia lowii TaxID=190385 RepID=UPI00247ACE3D|nr:uncharacterized protein LOC129750039 [Uranotaenia lowii]